MVSMSLGQPWERCNLGLMHYFQVLFSICGMAICVCVCMRVCFRQLLMSKHPTRSNKCDLYSFNSTIDVQAQIFKDGLTVEQVSCRNLGREMRSCDRSGIVNLID